MSLLRIVVISLIIILLGISLSYGQQNEAISANNTAEAIDNNGALNYDIDKLGYLSLFNFILPFALLLTSIVILIKNHKDINLFLAIISLICTSASLVIHEFAIVFLDNTAYEITMASTAILFVITILLFARCMSDDVYRLLLLNVVGFSILFMLLATIAFVTQYSIIQVASFTALGFIFAIILIIIVVNTFVE